MSHKLGGHGEPRPRIGFLTRFDARTPREWSGTPFHMARALQRNVGDVQFLGPVYTWISFQGRVRGRLARLWGGRYLFRHRISLARECARRVRERVRRAKLDVIVAPAGSALIAFLETDVPIVYTSDTTFDLLLGYHPEFTGMGERLEAEGQEVERRAIQRAAVSVFSSQWAADSAVRTYGGDPSRVHALPYGANLDIIPERGSLISRKRQDLCTLLFVGSPWERKGGPLACEVNAALRNAGVPAELVVVGPRELPARYAGMPGVTLIGRLGKGDVAQQQRLVDLYASATFFILPTLNESYGIVFCEASAGGTPSLAPRTGGVGGAIREGVNGFLVPPDAGAAPYVALIRELLEDWPRYLRLVESSREEYERRLNWDVWARRVGELVANLP
ncbi:MAG: glycosyltransferase family 4 protein [Gemmatimonadetes bacterium]|nr:glycosyltransferase family 4 protein [Gemmatimonadota bacterium]